MQAPDEPDDISNREYATITSTPNPEARTIRQKIHKFIENGVNFYRIHLTAFVVFPFIASGIFYASNGRFHVKYLDALFLCYSAMTVTGLTTVNLSTLTPWQQMMIYFLMIIRTSLPTQTGPISLSPVNSGSPRVDFALATGVEGRSDDLYRAFNLSTGANPNVPGTPYPTATSGSSSKYHGSGQFPGPFQIIQRLAKRVAPKIYKKLERSMTLPASRTLQSQNTSYLNFNLPTSRNSDFHTETLNDDELEELGGTEYRALRWLTYVVPLYFFGIQILAFTIFSPWLSTSKRYDAVFEAQPRLVNKTWFSLFQVMGAYTGGGLSLVDTGMVPFQTAYLMIFPMMFVIVAGNHAMPIFLRLVIWILSKIVREESDAYATLSFLLDHPRRCFLYLFPSHQTWFLLFLLILFSAIEWIGFAVLNNGLSAYESLPVGVRVVGGLFQGIAARASGFPIVPLSSFAPSLLFLYVIMMYIAVYPLAQIAMSIRSTNVYEERSLGVYEFLPEDEYCEPQGLEKIKDRRERIGKYLYWHFRRQMSIDIWWLVWGVFFVAVVERNNLMDEDKKWFDLFRVIFELVSAFGGIGLSLGFPDDNYSFAGAMRPLSKLIIIVIMVRGRHRGLPVAVDRAVVLPREMVPQSQRTGSKAVLDEKPTTTQEPQQMFSDFGA
ncbi:Low-affinity potassium transport protein [Leucoagaricus sp. SymC.cos]|nr:Low-affinity potassium transport protein [Leucoagaricus sp. SymC.cos]